MKMTSGDYIYCKNSHVEDTLKLDKKVNPEEASRLCRRIGGHLPRMEEDYWYDEISVRLRCLNSLTCY